MYDTVHLSMNAPYTVKFASRISKVHVSTNNAHETNSHWKFIIGVSVTYLVYSFNRVCSAGAAGNSTVSTYTV